MFADKNAETMSRQDLEQLQLERLKKTVDWVYEKSAFYKRSFDDAGVKPEDIQTLADIRKLPFLTMEEVRRTDVMDFVTLPLSGILRAGHFIEEKGEVTKLYTRDDIRQNVETTACTFIAAGITRGSVVGLQGDLSNSVFLDALYALESIGATVVPFGTNYRQWIRLFDLFAVDTIVSSQQLIMQLIIQLQAVGKNIADYSVERFICINDTNIQNPLQRHIEDRTTATVYNLFAPPELGFGGMMYQCSGHSGHHLREDYFLAEIVHFDGEDVLLDDGRMGELVITTLAAQAVPLIRYRTGQAVRRLSEPCSCGRTFCSIATPYTKI